MKNVFLKIILGIFSEMHYATYYFVCDVSFLLFVISSLYLVGYSFWSRRISSVGIRSPNKHIQYIRSFMPFRNVN
jgi:hypothetical protein